MKGLMICILATAEVLGVIYMMDSHQRTGRSLAASLAMALAGEDPSLEKVNGTR